MASAPIPAEAENIIKARIILCSFFAFTNAEKFEENIRHLFDISLHKYSVEYEGWLDLYSARLNQSKENIEEAIRLYRKATTIGHKGFLRIEAQAWFRLASIYNNFGAIDEAIKCYLDCVDICKQIGGLRLEVLALSSLSEIYLANGQASEALEICRNAISSATEDKSTRMRLHIRECTILLELNRISDIFLILKSISNDLEDYPNPTNEGSIKIIVGKAYRIEKKYLNSQKEFEQALQIYNKNGNPKLIINALQQLVELFIEINEYLKAWNLLNEAKEIAVKSNYQYGITASLELSVELYQKQGEFDKALTAFREFYDMKQKMLSQQAERRMELLRIEHQVKQKEQEAELYRLKSEQLEKQLMDKTSHLVSQAESMSRFRDDLKKILIEAKDPIAGLREVKGKLKDIPQIAVDWDEYDRNFSAVHPQFKQTILDRYPDLTPTEMKVCTLLRMELSSKEIAHLLTVDERSIENYRYKLRKKFKLEKESLSLFLSKV
ncbi:MAG TPA: LuxR C-terminal-related transcriptional regulator [Candidatus Kapabacteria bacterium]|nr:LuxR C-terminal-related transcriptional regulator [Candidatus Kapabacteria bacterium]